METQARIARIEGMNLETGAFPMTLATEGEASDGHILSIKGGQIPERMPMLLSHWNDPTAAVGSVVEPKKHTKDSPPRLSATGQIEMGGQGMPAEVRRDVALMIDKGHINAVSIRWDEVPGKSTRRVNLPSNHKYFVDAEEEKGPARWGYFFEEWRALEGSIVALGADPGALIGRAEESTGEVAAFWRAMADDAEKERRPAKAAATLAALRTGAKDALEAGATIHDVVNAAALTLDENHGDEEFIACRIGEFNFFLPASVAAQLEDEREARKLERTKVELELASKPAPDPEPAPREPDPEPAPEAGADQRSPLELGDSQLFGPADVQALGKLFAEKLDEADQRQRQTVTELLHLATGKVT